ncbi:stearoyl-CoA desaturase [Sporodiniella umbellata]|nr:stearoyl-CoA desaturase [Sporodiniella umbellata]
MLTIEILQQTERTKTESMKEHLSETIFPPLIEEPITLRNFDKIFELLNISYAILAHGLAVYTVFYVKLEMKTFLFFMAYGYVGGFCITAGYHRMWSHRAFRGSLPLRLFFAVFSSMTLQRSILWWCHKHRLHHRYTDTDKDPYNARRGLFYSHAGWLFIRRPEKRVGFADVSDLESDPVVVFQYKYFPVLAILTAVVIPTSVCTLGWGDFKGGFLWSSAFRAILTQHITFCVNSLAHYLGEATYDDHNTPRDHWLTALITMGEGYHNFHHQFPQDYRNAIRYYEFDPTKWLIYLFSLVGLAFDLKTFPENEISKGVVYMKEKKIKAEKAKLNYGTPLKDLPVYTWDEFQSLVLNENKKWILMEGVLYDVKSFMREHPGGVKYLSTAIGKDMTTAFNGGIYNHSNGARNLLTQFRVGVLLNGMQVMTDADVETEAQAYDSSLEYDTNVINKKVA